MSFYAETVRANYFAVECYDSMARNVKPVKSGPLRLTHDTRNNLDCLKLDVAKKFFPNLVPVANVPTSGLILPEEVPQEVRYRVGLLYLRNGTSLGYGIDQDGAIEDALIRGKRSAQDPAHVVLKAYLRPAVDYRQVNIQCCIFARTLGSHPRRCIGQPFPASDLRDMTEDALAQRVRAVMRDNGVDTRNGTLAMHHYVYDKEGGREFRTWRKSRTSEELLDIIHTRGGRTFNIYVTEGIKEWA